MKTLAYSNFLIQFLLSSFSLFQDLSKIKNLGSQFSFFPPNWIRMPSSLKDTLRSYPLYWNFSSFSSFSVQNVINKIFSNRNQNFFYGDLLRNLASDLSISNLTIEEIYKTDNLWLLNSLYWENFIFELTNFSIDKNLYILVVFHILQPKNSIWLLFVTPLDRLIN